MSTQIGKPILQGFVANAIGAGTGLFSNSASGGDVALDTAIVGAAGGLAAQLTGGKFASGFITAAFANLYNKWGRVLQYAGGGAGAAGGGFAGFVTGLVTDGPLAALAEGAAGAYYGWRYGSLGGRIIGETLDIVLSESDDNKVIIDDKIKAQLGARGWTEAEIQELANGDPSGSSRDNRGPEKTPDGFSRDDIATVYGDKTSYIVVNDRTRELVQISDKTNPNWIPDSRIKWNK